MKNISGKYRWVCKNKQTNRQTNKQTKTTHTKHVRSTVLKQVNLTPLPTAHPATTFPHGVRSISLIGRW
jgi:hypothetical protein